jgi:hypothetical protein
MRRKGQPKYKRPTRNLVFGCLEPTTSLDIIDDQIHRMFDYKNMLVDIDLARRAATDALISANSVELRAVEAELADVTARLEAERTAIKARNAAARRRRQTAEERDSARALSARQKELRKRRKELRDKAFADKNKLRAEFGAINDAYLSALKEAYANCGLYWGNKLTVNEAARAFAKGAPPEKKFWHPDGMVGVQLQTQKGDPPFTPAKLFGCKSTLLRFELLPYEPKKVVDGQYVRAVGRRGGKRQYGICWFRVGSDAKGHPVWAKVPFVNCWDIPADADIKWAYLHRRKVGTKFIWFLRLSVSRDSWAKETADTGFAAVDLGWRKKDDGSIRVAAYKGSDGAEEELVIPKHAVARMEHVEYLQGVRDKLFNLHRDMLRDWIAANPGLVPEWFKKETETLYAWRSQRKLAKLVNAWAKARFEGDDDIFRHLNGWEEEITVLVKNRRGEQRYDADGLPLARKQPKYFGWRLQNNHLYDWCEFERRKAINWRNTFYRTWIAGMRKRYAVAVIENTNYKRLQDKKKAEEATAENRTARWQQKFAAVGTLNRYIKEGFRKFHAVQAAYTTQVCNACKKQDAFDAAAELVRKCRHCGVTQDQDFRAAENLKHLFETGQECILTMAT